MLTDSLYKRSTQAKASTDNANCHCANPHPIMVAIMVVSLPIACFIRFPINRELSHTAVQQLIQSSTKMQVVSQQNTEKHTLNQHAVYTEYSHVGESAACILERSARPSGNISRSQYKQISPRPSSTPCMYYRKRNRNKNTPSSI